MTDIRAVLDTPTVPRKRLVGYADRFSVHPGETLRFMVSSETSYRASIVRLTGRPEPGGPERSESVPWAKTHSHCNGRVQPIDCGSYGVVDEALLTAGREFTFQVALFPTTPLKGRQLLMGQWSDTENRGAALLLDESGCVCLLTGDGTHRYMLGTGVPVAPRQWILVTASYDATSGHTRLRQVPREHAPTHLLTVEGFGKLVPPSPGTLFSIAASVQSSVDGSRTSHDHFNGKLEAPLVLRRAMTDADAALVPLDPSRVASDHDTVAAWDFSIDMDSTRFIDVSLNGYHGQLVNIPTRAMTGWHWTGKEHCWRHAREQYGAIHFHDDDLYDAGWTPDFAVKIPEDARSGVYAARLQTETESEIIPFFLRGSPSGQQSDLLLLFPTASYLAYANEHLAIDAGETEALSGHVAILQKEDTWLAEHREVGLSLYDTHSDGSGVGYSSRFRPILNLRPGRMSAWIGSKVRVPWQFNADLDLIAFLENLGIAYDVATDEDLHQEGVGLLSRYRCVMTGTHPEYHSTPMLDAIEAYLDHGGRFMYMGGNGFYWRVAFNDNVPGVIELRRAEDGIRDWSSQPGEYYHSFSGELGGLWRRIGRPPQRLVGVGMVSQGFDYSGYFRRSTGADDARARFILDGIPENIIGDFGSVGGGAAGLELDRADPELGTPAHALIIASSKGHTNLTFAVPEDVGNVSDELVATRNTSLRGDVVFFETPSGGAVFSVGTIAWAGSLAHSGYDNNIARMTTNVLQRFLAAEPFEYPSAT